MQFDKKYITLKNGKKCILRSLSIEDAENLLKYLKMTSSETNFMIRYPEEITMSVENEKIFLENIRRSSNKIMIAAFVDNKLVANSSVMRVNDNFKLSHRATFGIAIIKQYWGLGIGTALMKEIINCAKTANFEQLELEVVSKNDAAINLYKKFGFVKYGIRERSIKLKDGSYYTEYLMMKEL